MLDARGSFGASTAGESGIDSGAVLVAASRVGVAVVAELITYFEAVSTGGALDWACPADFLFAVRGTAI